ncbi:MAG: GNAT family N-acetyltransferase [Thermodesulfobacteriota bacterium]
MSEIVVRKYQAGDEKGLTLLAGEVWGSTFGEDYWRWKYLQNPLHDNFSYVAVCNGNIAGFVGGMPWRFFVMGKECISGQVTDMMVHPAWRNKGVFFPVNRKNLDDITARTNFHYGFTNPTSFRVYKKRFHYEGFNPLKMQKVLNIKSAIWQGLRQGKSVKLSTLFDLISRVLSGRKKVSSKKARSTPASLVVKRIERFDAGFDKLWEKAHKKLKIATIRDSRYLNWRYVGHPQLQYTIFAAEGNGELYGFVVLRCENKEGIRKGLIIDLLVDPGHVPVAEILINESLKFFRSQKAAVINTWMFEDNPIYGLFVQNGFSAKPANQVVVLIKSFSPDIPTDYLRDTRNWYLTMGDCEVF